MYAEDPMKRILKVVLYSESVKVQNKSAHGELALAMTR